MYLKDNIRHKFIQDLRNYTSHKSYLKVGSEFSYNIEWNEPKKSIYVSKGELLNWSGWCSQAKEFIHSREEKIILNDILKSHFEEFIFFQNSIFFQLLEVDKKLTDKFLVDISRIFSKAKHLKMTQLILFDESFIRYFNYLYKKNLH